MEATRGIRPRTCPACNSEHTSIRMLCTKCHASTPAGTCIFQPCDRVPKSGRICGAHYQRLVAHGDPDTRLKFRGDQLGGFWARVDKDAHPTCWLWTGHLNASGYAQMASGSCPMAHRFSYELHIGPIPEGWEVDHVHERGCRNRHCVNPDHLEAVTSAENKRRMMIVRGYKVGEA